MDLPSSRVQTYIVTVKLATDPSHDPLNKRAGNCEASDLCTDRTGAHHSFCTEAHSLDEIRRKFGGLHITRIELARWV